MRKQLQRLRKPQRPPLRCGGSLFRALRPAWPWPCAYGLCICQAAAEPEESTQPVVPTASSSGPSALPRETVLMRAVNACMATLDTGNPLKRLSAAPPQELSRQSRASSLRIVMSPCSIDSVGGMARQAQRNQHKLCKKKLKEIEGLQADGMGRKVLLVDNVCR